MRILIDIGHPAHVHYYKNLAKELKENGHLIFWTVKKGSSAVILLNSYGFKYTILPRKKDGILNKLVIQVIYDVILLIFCIIKRIDIAIGTSVTIAHVSRIVKTKSIVFDDDDDEVQPFFVKYVHPFADSLLSPDCLSGKRKRKDTIYYPGFHELAYLHPKRFKPDNSVLNEAGLKLGETFFIMRFNVFKAHHDIGIEGLSLEQKLILISILEPFGKIFITTEREIEPELMKYRIRISPEKVHSLMYYSTIFLGDSQTMTSEASVMGIPALRCNSFAGRISYLEELEHQYNLTYAFSSSEFEQMIDKLQELLSLPNLKLGWQNKRQMMLRDKIDVTSYWKWFIENYPESTDIKKYQYNFWIQFI